MPRKYLTIDEVNQLCNAISKTKHGLRDRLIIYMMFRHGLRRSEAASLRWEDVNLNNSTIWIERLKGSISTNHPLSGKELRDLRKLQRAYPSSLPWLFINQKKQPMSARTISKIVNKAGQLAGFEYLVNSHSLRHGCGYHLANKGVDLRLIQSYLGHANINNTVIYTEICSDRFNRIWD